MQTFHGMAKQLIRDAEVLSKYVFTTSNDQQAIGYGHKLLEHEINKYKLNEITLQEVEILLEQDVEKTIDLATRDFNDLWQQIEDERRAVIIDITFTQGSLRDWPELYAAILKADYHEAAKQILISDYAKLAGNRAQRNASIMRDGTEYKWESKMWNQ